MKKQRQLTLYTLLFVLVIVSGFLVTFYREQTQMDKEWSVQSTSTATRMLIPSGHIIGVRMTTEGIYVLGTSDVETATGNQKPSETKLKKGDIIHRVNGLPLESKEQLRTYVEENGEAALELAVERKGEEVVMQIMPAYSQSEHVYKLGVWVKDGTQGIGTLTYIDPQTDTFGALGHGITDNELKSLLLIKEGYLTQTTLTQIKKGEAGTPGQLGGTVSSDMAATYGEVIYNTHLGIYGRLNKEGQTILQGEAIPVATREEVQEGEAIVMAQLTDEVQPYKIMIQKVARYTSEPTKGMVIKIVDPDLLELTNGIVQGMSGSPIIQNDKLVGALTHVFVNDPTKGYGIFIENMLNTSENGAMKNMISDSM